MTLYLLSWVTFSCPSFLGMSVVPVAMRPLVCTVTPRSELVDPARLMYRLREAGPEGRPGVRQLTIRGGAVFKTRKVKVTWEPKITVH